MSGMIATMTITEFLLARIAEDEAAAQAATSGPWNRSSQYGRVDVFRHPYSPGDEMVAERVDAYDALHIMLNDPARVLAECEAKRRIIATLFAWCPDPVAPDRVETAEHDAWRMLLDLAAVYADHPDHPDYRDEWRA